MRVSCKCPGRFRVRQKLELHTVCVGRMRRHKSQFHPRFHKPHAFGLLVLVSYKTFVPAFPAHKWSECYTGYFHTPPRSRSARAPAPSHPTLPRLIPPSSPFSFSPSSSLTYSGTIPPTLRQKSHRYPLPPSHVYALTREKLLSRPGLRNSVSLCFTLPSACVLNAVPPVSLRLI